MRFILIERYIFKRALVATLVTLGSLAGVVWIVQALRQLDVIASKGAAILAYLQLTSLAVPMLILAIIPLALLVATIHTINLLNSNSELVVINASGASGWVLAKPLIILALLCSLFVGFVGHFVTAWSLVALKEKAAELQADLVSVIVREGTFSKVKQGLTFHIAKRDAGGILRGILISDERDPKKTLTYTASEGVVTKFDGNSLLLLKNGEIHSHDLTDGATTVINYRSYAFDLATFSGKSKQLVLRPKERTTPQLLYPDLNDHYLKKAPGLYRAAIHERFSEMLWPFTYVIIVLAFAGQARSTRQGYGAAIGSAVMFTMILRGFAFSGISSLKADPNAVYLVYGLPIMGIVIGGWFVFTNQPASLPKPAADWVNSRNLALQNKFQQLYSSYLLFRRNRASSQS